MNDKTINGTRRKVMSRSITSIISFSRQQINQSSRKPVVLAPRLKSQRDEILTEGKHASVPVFRSRLKEAQT